MNGILLINKPANITSHDVVAAVRKLFRIKKVGHAGTLDPFATGLLLLCIGKATKIVRYLMDCDKEYIAMMKLGETTDTQDCTGTIVEQRPVPSISEHHILNVFTRFTGEISQIPPMYSARKVEGERLYTLARQGKTVPRKSQQVTVHTLELLEYSLPYLRFRAGCSKGTYIRTLAFDIGEALGCGAHLTALERTRIGQFSLNQAYSLEQTAQLGSDTARQDWLISMDEALSFFPGIRLCETDATRLTHGVRVFLPVEEYTEGNGQHFSEQIVRIYNAAGIFIALAGRTAVKQHGDVWWQLQPLNVFIS